MNILWIASIWPEPTSSAAGFRTMQLIQACVSNGHTVTVTSPCQANTFQKQLDSIGIQTKRFEPNDSTFDQFIQSLQPNVVVFDRFMLEEQFGWRVKAHCPTAVRILDTVDLHCLRRAREEVVTEGEDPMNLPAEKLFTEDAKREIGAILRSDLSIIISDAERALLTERFEIPHYLTALCRYYTTPLSEPPSFKSRSNVATIGNFFHAPNLDSIKLLHSTLWPKIRSLLVQRGIPDPELHVYGAYPPTQMEKLTSEKTGFIVKGWTEDSIATLANYRLTLAPLRFGAGIKGKVSDSWAAGTPVVGSNIAAEGMHEKLPFGGMIADDPENFCQAVADLYNSEVQWHEHQRRGFAILDKFYNKDLITTEFLHSIERALANRDTNRIKNFIGSILWHQMNRSTEFFSRWIEEKNKHRKESPPCHHLMLCQK